MSEAKVPYTPGPWKDAIDIGEHIVVKRNGYVIALISRSNVYFEEEVMANARLIAAAPELYEMLNEALINIERVLRGDRKAVPFRAEWIEEARAICAKVRGDEEERR